MQLLLGVCIRRPALTFILSLRERIGTSLLLGGMSALTLRVFLDWTVRLFHSRSNESESAQGNSKEADGCSTFRNRINDSAGSKKKDVRDGGELT